MSGLELSQTLVTECKRSSATSTLYKYNDALVRQLCREIRALDKHLSTTLAAVAHFKANDIPQAELCTMTMIQAMIERDKRCLLAYHQYRLGLLKELYWNVGGALPQILNNPDVRAKLSPHEVDFMREYSKMVGDWRSELLDVVDLAMGVERPPKDVNVPVIVVRECGVVNTELGEIDFQKGQRYL